MTTLLRQERQNNTDAKFGLGRVKNFVTRIAHKKFKDFYFIENSKGQLFTFGLIVSKLVNTETLGDYDLRLRKAAVAHEQFGLEKGKTAKAVRISPIDGAHLATDEGELGYGPKTVPADSLTGVFLPKEKPSEPVCEAIEPELNVLPGYENYYSKYEEWAKKLFTPRLSTTGYGSAFIGALGVNFKIGARGHREDICTLDMLVETLLTKYAHFYEKFNVESLSRQSFGKKDVEGLLDVGTKPHEFSFSLPLVCKDPNSDLRNSREVGEIIPMEPDTSAFADIFNNPPEEWNTTNEYRRNLRNQANILKGSGDEFGYEIAFAEYEKAEELYQKYHRAIPVRFRSAYEGKTNPDSGSGMARIIIVSSAEVDENNSIPILKHRLRVQQAIANWCEEFCAPAELSDLEKSMYPGYARVPGTFSILENISDSDYGKNFAQLDPSITPKVFETVVQIPYKELSLLARSFPQRNHDGSLVTYMFDEEGRRQILKPPTDLPIHARRDLRNEPGNKGAFGISGGGMKMIEIDYPYDNSTLHIYESLVCTTFANACTDDFEQTGYAYDSFQGGPALYNLHGYNEPNNRAQIYLAGWNRLIQAMEKPPQDTLTGWQQEEYYLDGNNKKNRTGGDSLFKQATDYSQTSSSKVKGENGVPVERALNDRVYQVWRELNGQWPEIFVDTTWLDMIQAFYDDLKEACQVEWIDEKKTQGYLVLDRAQGMDNELPAVIYNLLITAAVANSLDELNANLPEGKRISWKQTDIVRSWPSAFYRIRSPEITKAMKAMGIDPRYLPEDQEDPSIISTEEEGVTFRYRFVVKVALEDIPERNLPYHLKIQKSLNKNLEFDVLYLEENSDLIDLLTLSDSPESLFQIEELLLGFKNELELESRQISLVQLNSLASAALLQGYSPNQLQPDLFDRFSEIYPKLDLPISEGEHQRDCIFNIFDRLGYSRNSIDLNFLDSNEGVDKFISDIESELKSEIELKKMSPALCNYLRINSFALVSYLKNNNATDAQIRRLLSICSNYIESSNSYSWSSQQNAKTIVDFFTFSNSGSDESSIIDLIKLHSEEIASGLAKQKAFRIIDTHYNYRAKGGNALPGIAFENKRKIAKMAIN
jgi:hypothetical protein